MSQDVITSKVDSWIDEARPSDTHGNAERLRLFGAGGTRRRALVWFPLPGAIPAGATVRAGDFVLRLRGAPSDWGAPGRSVTVSRITSEWFEGRATWNNQPTISATNAVTQTLTGADKTEVRIPIAAMLQDVASGGQWFGLRIDTTATAGDPSLYSAEATWNLRPKLDVTWAKVPLPPDDLHPAGGRVVSKDRPVFTWTFRDAFGDQSQAQAQIEVRTVSPDVSFYGPALGFTELQEWDSLNPPIPPVMTTLTAGTAYKWRVRAVDGDGLVSGWSDYQEFSYRPLPTLTITNPPAGTPATVEETTPPIAWSIGAVIQARAEIVIRQYDYDVEAWERVYKKEEHVTTITTHTIPAGKIQYIQRDYEVIVRSWDNYDRETLPGGPAYAEARRTFQLVRGPISAVTALTVVPFGPGVRMNFTRAVRPDYFAVIVDGVIADDRIRPIDTETAPGATTYTMDYYLSDPGELHTYEIAAVVNDAGKLKLSTGNATATLRHDVIGIWLVHPKSNPSDEYIEVFIAGTESPSEEIGEAAETLTPLGRRSPVRVRDAMRGYEGSISGVLHDWLGLTARQYRNRLLRMKALLGDPDVFLIFGDRSIPILLEETACPPNDDGTYSVSINYRQAGEFQHMVTP